MSCKQTLIAATLMIVGLTAGAECLSDAQAGDMAEKIAAKTPAATPEELELYTPLKSTGHGTAFNNTLNYFPRHPITPRQPANRPGVPPTTGPGGTPGRPGGR